MHLEQHTLQHDGVIPGARGHKKQIIPKGNKVWCIVHDGQYFWACYLYKEQAAIVRDNLQACADGTARRPIKLDTLIAWNFSRTIPVRVARPK